MKTSIAYALAAVKLVAGHATFQSFVISGKDQGQHFAVQTPFNGSRPVMDVTSPNMVCNGGKATADFVEVSAGSKITMQWHGRDPVTISDDEPIATSHKGPVMVYIAPAKGNGEGAVWTKIYEDGYSHGKWGVEKFIADKGAIAVTLPDLVDGSYIIRPEIIALHEANKLGGAQFYNGCGQIKVTGGSKALPRTGTDLTKAYSATDSGILCNIYYGLTTYQVPGPAVWDDASSGTSSATRTQSATSVTADPTKIAVSSFTTSIGSAAPVTTQVKHGKPSATTATQAPAASFSCSDSGSTLPETFTITRFIAWLKQQTHASGKAHRHARAFHL